MYGKVSTAKKLINDCVIVTQNRHCITILDRATYGKCSGCGLGGASDHVEQTLYHQEYIIKRDLLYTLGIT